MPKIFNVDLGTAQNLGTTIEINYTPKKESTQAHYYTFEN
jgi:hypothetical protein